MIKWLVALGVIWFVWQAMGAKPKRPLPPPVADEAEARAILGVGRDADAETIRAAHRRLMGGVHPDRGGSAELARRVNAARDLLLR
jgi:DnaJ homolog subfamily C member 19